MKLPIKFSHIIHLAYLQCGQKPTLKKILQDPAARTDKSEQSPNRAVNFYLKIYLRFGI